LSNKLTDKEKTMKNKLAGLAIMGLMALGLSLPAEASLVVSGTVLYEGTQRNLIYDDDLEITWLDYTRADDTWGNQTSWAAGLSLTVNGVTYDSWRLPATVDGLTVSGYDGTTTAGYNITSSEMGHLYYSELGNKGFYDTSGNSQEGWGLINTGDFHNLDSSWYWSGTTYALNPTLAWYFRTNRGNQSATSKDKLYRALAVLPGQIQTVPEPATLLLIGSGLAGLVAVGKKRRGH